MGQLALMTQLESLTIDTFICTEPDETLLYGRNGTKLYPPLQVYSSPIYDPISMQPLQK